MPKESILIVEDEQIVALDIQTSLEMAGYTVAGCTNQGEAAVKKAQELHPNLVLMDIGLKGELDGIEAAIQLREKFDIPVIFLTAFANPSTMERARLAQPYGYMLKPFDERELVSNIEMALYKHDMESKLRESEARFRRLADNALDIIFRYEVSPSMRLTYINPVVQSIMGYTPDECYTDPMLMLNMIHPEDRGIMLGIMQSLTLPDGPLFARWLDIKGAVHWMESRIVSVFNAAGQLVAAEGITRDITERKRSEEAVSNSEKRFRALIENGRDNISVLAADGTLLWESPATKSTLGYASNQFIGHNIFELMHPDDMEWTRQMYLRVVAETGRTEEGMFRLQHSNSSWLWVEATATNLLDEPNVRGIVINYRDVTERKHLSESLQHSRDLLLVLSRANQTVLKAGTTEEIYHAVGAQIQGLGFDTTVLTIDPDGQHLAIRYTTFAEQLLRAGEKMTGVSLHKFRLPYSQDSTFGRIIASGTAQYSDQICASITEALPNILGSLAGQMQRLFKIEQAITVPLRVGEETIGLFTIVGTGLNKEDLPAVEIFTAQLGISLHKARLTQQLQAELAERKDAEEKLRASDELYRILIDTSPDAIGLFDFKQNQLVTANQKFLQQHGFSTLDELQASQWKMEFVIEADQARMQAHIDDVLSKNISNGLEITGRRLDGSVFPAEFNSSAIRDAQGNPTALVFISRDITERKRADEALRESQSLYHSLVEVSPLSICRKDLAGRFTFANRQFLALSNHTLADIVGKTDFDLHPPELAEKYRRNEQAILKSGRVHELIETRTILGGEPIIIQSIKVPIYDGNGKINGIQISFWDITEQKRAEAALSESEERLRLSLQASNQGLYDLNVQTGAAIVNREYAQMLGYNPETFVETNEALIERMHPDDRAIATKAYSDFISGIKPEYRVEFRQKTKSDDWKWILSLGKVVEYDSEGKPHRMLGTHTDITERKQAEAELRKLTQAVEQSANVIVVTDVEGKIEYANPKFTQITGYTLPEALGQNPRILRSGKHTPAFYQNLWQTINSGKIWQGEFHNRRKDGSLYWEYATVSPVFDPTGKIINFIAVKEDITARKALEAAEHEQHQLADALRDTAVALNSTLKLDDILNRIFDNISKLVNYDMAMVSLVEGNTIRKIRYHSNPEKEYNSDMQANLINDPIWKELIQFRQPYLIPDIQTDDRWQAIPGIKRIRCLLCVPIESHDNIVGVINIISATPNFFTSLQAEHLTTFANQAAVAIENARMFERTQRLALTDALTELHNMRYFNESANLEFERTHRNKRTLCVAMMDLDHFKKINDTHGHGMGDLVLREVAARISGAVRAMDIIARYGGDEFVILLPETGLEHACQIADRVRLAVASSPIKNKDMAISVTLSLGVVELHPGARNLDELIKCADQAMYTAKAAGKNRVKIYQAERADMNEQ